MRIYLGEHVAVQQDIDYNVLRINSEKPLECMLLDGRIHILNASTDMKGRKFHVGYLKVFKKKVKDGIFKYQEFANVEQEVDDYVCVRTEEHVMVAPIDEMEYHFEESILRMRIKFHNGFTDRIYGSKIYMENFYFEIQHEHVEDDLWILCIRTCGKPPIEFVIKGEGFLLRHTLYV
eukprot:jgi/Antlo1/242/1913